MRYAHLYNHQIPQRSLGHVAPVEALKRWQRERPELFKNRVYNLTGRDIVRFDDNYGRVNG
jgi:hypothetical protein